MAYYASDNGNGDNEGSAFRKAFKFYKGRHKPMNLFDKIIDVDNVRDDRIVEISLSPDRDSDVTAKALLTADLHLRYPNEWKLYTFRDKPGLTLARDIFTPYGAYYWAYQCLARYPAYPNVSNIQREIRLKPDFDGDVLRYQDLARKLRWITLGYHHDWDTKFYSETNRSAMPDNMQILSRLVARRCLGFADYRAEAAIVNFYHENSTLSGHVDKSERNMDAPLLSFSFGQSAIFLVGGSNPGQEPIAVYLRNGDMISMDREVRLSYHAVPRIANDFELDISDIYSNSKLDTRVIEYLNNNRINMNIRQVN